MKSRSILRTLAFALALTLPLAMADDGELKAYRVAAELRVPVIGDPDDEWRFQLSTDLSVWTNAPAVGTVFSGIANLRSAALKTDLANRGFIRAVQTKGLFDSNVFRTVSLTITSANYTTLLANARNSGGNVPALLSLDNGVTATNVGARYKGNTSYTMAGAKKSVNLDINYTNAEARVMGYRALNLNNAAGDESIMREALYFNILREYAPSPKGSMAKLVINGQNWGVYSFVDQINNDLLDEWFPSHDGDRWRAPNIAGGGGGFTSGNSAFSFLGTNISSYRSNYELKSDNSTNAWERLTNAIVVLNRTPSDQLREKVEQVFAVDRWLWFMVLENLFVDDDSYWNKGADYAFYYEPESGRIHPVQHDGNEALTSAMGVTPTISPVIGSTGTNRPLLSKLLGIPELRQRYLAHMRTAIEERFNPAFLTATIEHYQRLSIAEIIADPKKGYTMTTYSNEVRALKTFVTNRYNYLRTHAELTPVPPAIVAVRDPDPLPTPDEVPFVAAEVRAVGTNGLDSVWLYWRDKTYGVFSRGQMFDDGAHGDGAAGDGIFGGPTTNFPAGHKIHYYVEARSANPAKAAAFSPPRAEQETYSYRVALATASNTVVVINEILASNTKTIADPQGEYEDWIELHNLANQPVDLTGIYLTDDEYNPTKWPFPPGTVIPAGGYLIIWADEDSSETPGLHANFKLERSGESVFLIDTDANLNAVLDKVAWGALPADRSFGRSPSDADVLNEMQPTPGQANAAF